MAQRFAPNFNPVTLLSPNEITLSEALRWALSENETHGQGRLFLDCFLADLLQEDPEQWAGAKVLAEVSTADRSGRIDLLLLAADSTRSVVIENKPYAGWQTDQLNRYLADQLALRLITRVHALIGGRNPQLAIREHLGLDASAELPAAISVSGYDEVAAWLEVCGSLTRADKVRTFLIDLAGHCRQYVYEEPSMSETHKTADLILTSGDGALQAAFDIAAALPVAQTRDVARRVGGTFEMISTLPSVQLTLESVPINFVLFHNVAPFGGVTEGKRASMLCHDLPWGQPEKAWPRWIWLKKIDNDGPRLIDAAHAGDTVTVAEMLPAIARRMILSATLPL